MLAHFPTAPCCFGWFFCQHSSVFFLRNSGYHLDRFFPIFVAVMNWPLGFSSTLLSDLSTWLGILLPDLPLLMHREFNFTVTLLVHWSSPFLGLSTLITLICPVTMVTGVEITRFWSHLHPKLRCFLYSHVFRSFHLIHSHPQWASYWFLRCL